MPEHKVLDIGAGSLRIGWWFLHFIEPSNYYVIEPVKDRIHTAVEILGVDDININYNTDFAFPPVDFDFVIARSIWTHASKDMISKLGNGSPASFEAAGLVEERSGSVLLASKRTGPCRKHPLDFLSATRFATSCSRAR